MNSRISKDARYASFARAREAFLSSCRIGAADLFVLLRGAVEESPARLLPERYAQTHIIRESFFFILREERRERGAYSRA